jgi:serine/threonine protein kinase
MNLPAPSVETILAEAIEIPSPDDRRAYLDRACGGDPALRERVERLIANHFRAGGEFLKPPAPRPVVTIDEVPAPERLGTFIGPYKLLEQIGEGGFGVVFLAEQQLPVRRKVALKIIKPGMDTRQVIARFEAERQALALMDHPHIAQIHDGGTTPDGRPFFVMELVKGIPITDYCDQCRLTTRERLDLFLSVCQAVQHAHQKGVIHRDLKPSNVLVAIPDGQPMVKVIDFGMAKAINQRLSEHTVQTGFHQLIGTPLYMSPEQAEMSPLDVDTRADIYALGVLLYELLTGTTPFEKERLSKASYDELRRIIREEEPPRPSARLSTLQDKLTSVAAQRRIEPRQLLRTVKGDLDWIVLKALEKDRNRRYETANAFALDVQRYLADEPVEARPPTLGYRLGKAVRKHKVGLSVACAFVLLLAAGLAASVWQAARARQAEGLMQLERDRALDAQKELQLALTHQLAQGLDSELRQLEVVGRIIAGDLACGQYGTDEELFHWLRDLLLTDDRIHGLTVGFEPKEFDPEQPDYCLYVHRGPKDVEKKQLARPGAKPYRSEDWYARPLRGAPMWTPQPCLFDEGEGSKVFMVSFLLPLRHKDRKKPVGVVTVDVSVPDFFRKLHSRLPELQSLPQQGKRYFVVGHSKLSWNGTASAGYFIASPSCPEQRYPARVTDGLAGTDEAYANLVRRIVQGARDSGRAIDPTTGKQSTFFFAPVPSAEWTFVVVLEDPPADSG